MPHYRRARRRIGCGRSGFPAKAGAWMWKRSARALIEERGGRLYGDRDGHTPAKGIASLSGFRLHGPRQCGREGGSRASLERVSLEIERQERAIPADALDAPRHHHRARPPEGALHLGSEPGWQRHRGMTHGYVGAYVPNTHGQRRHNEPQRESEVAPPGARMAPRRCAGARLPVSQQRSTRARADWRACRPRRRASFSHPRAVRRRPR
jgi:hypothetical protein